MAAIFAIGKPVAFDASADDRDTRGFISMTTIRPSAGLTANWMFEPPVSTPTRRMMRRAASRIRWYSLSVSVRIGATVMLSPVCTPIGSMFSIEQMTTKLSATSRITSSSNSFQPITDSSIEDLVHRAQLEAALGELAELFDVVGDAAADAAQRERRADDERKAERPRQLDRLGAATRATPLCGTSRPISRIASLNSCRSSATLIASIDAPISLTLYFVERCRRRRDRPRG